MTKITKNNFGKKLTKYGALSLAIAGVADATGQVVYTDVDPDFVGGMGDSFIIDFDNDGVDDVTILQSNNGNYELVQASATGSNGVARFDAGNSYVYASNLAEGTAIDSNLTFASFGSLCAGPGYTGSQFCGEGESFVGIQFDISGSNHYGWVRVDVADSGNFIVLDYAYESTAGTAINAGDMGPVQSVSDQVFQGFSQFVDRNNNLNLSANTAMEKVSIVNSLGQTVISQRLSNTDETLNISSLSNGIYIANVTINGANKSFKIVRK